MVEYGKHTCGTLFSSHYALHFSRCKLLFEEHCRNNKLTAIARLLAPESFPLFSVHGEYLKAYISNSLVNIEDSSEISRYFQICLSI